MERDISLHCGAELVGWAHMDFTAQSGSVCFPWAGGALRVFEVKFSCLWRDYFGLVSKDLRSVPAQFRFTLGHLASSQPVCVLGEIRLGHSVRFLLFWCEVKDPGYPKSSLSWSPRAV